MGRWAAAGVFVVLVGAACSGDSASPRVAPLTPTDPDRLAPAQAAAIEELAGSGSSAAPNGDHHAHADAGPASTVPLTPADRAIFSEQWADAVAAVAWLDTAAEAAARGYTRSAVQGAGVGVHWVNWTLIDAPFDPRRPSMLLFDERQGAGDLVGFSYWLRSEAPEGFAGPNDVWHQHTNLCIVNGWVDREGVTEADDCAGQLLAGADLWMLHAWVVPGRSNAWGDFATLHPALCPPESRTPDIARCPVASSDEP